MLWLVLQPVIFSLLWAVNALLPEKIRQETAGAASSYCAFRASAQLCGRTGWLCEAALGKPLGAALLLAAAGGTLIMLWLLDKKEESPLYACLYIFFCTSAGNRCLGADTAACCAYSGKRAKWVLLLFLVSAQSICLLFRPVPELTAVLGWCAMLFRGVRGLSKTPDVSACCAGALLALAASFMR